MSQHDYSLANQSGASFRSDLNNALAAIVSQNSGATEPTTTYAYQWWADTTTGLLKIRNAANTAWITVGTLANANLGLLGTSGGTLTGALLIDDAANTPGAPALAFDGDINTGIYRSAADKLNISAGGTERVEFGTTEVVFNEDGANCDFRVEGDTNANLLFIDASAEAVGIGTSTPASYDSGADNLVVSQGSGNGGITIVTDSSSAGGLVFADGTTTDQKYRGIVRYDHAADEMQFWTAASERVTISSTGDLTVPSLNGGPLAGTRNRIINGSMDVSQRGIAFANAGGYTLDRWYVNRYGGASGLTVGQVYAAFSTKKNWISLQRDSGNTSTATGSMYQPIEGINCRDLAGSTVTASFTLGTGGTLSATSNNVGIYLYYQTTSTDIGLSGSWTLVSSTSFSVASSTSPTRYTASFSVPSTATQLLIEIKVTFAGTAGADDRYYFTEVQLEAGSVATPFERRSYGQELALCQRYFHKSYNIGTALGTSNSTSGSVGTVTASTAGEAMPAARYPVTMRANPALTFYSTDTGTAGKVRNVSTNSDVNSAAPNAGGESGHFGMSGNWSSGQIYRYQYAADSEL